MKFDLHCHSYFSDGELSPAAVIGLAIENDISHLALTDHDTCAGLIEAQDAADGTSLNLIKGLELSCSWENQLLHVLGLDIDTENAALEKLITQNKERRLDRAEQMFVDFEKHNIDLREQVATLLEGRAVPTRPHFAQALIDAGYAKNKNQAFKRYLVRGKPGYIPMDWPELDEVANAINLADGIAVLAHPMRYKFTRTRLVRLIKDMQVAGVHGMEVCTPTNDASQITMLSNLAMQYDLLASMGSDFHATNQPWARLGSAQELPAGLTPVWTEFHKH